MSLLGSSKPESYIGAPLSKPEATLMSSLGSSVLNPTLEHLYHHLEPDVGISAGPNPNRSEGEAVVKSWNSG